MIQLDNISVRYGAKHAPLALQPTSLSFKPGEITVLLGASGAGKSTLLRAINHLVRPCSGKVFFDDIGELNCRKRIQAARRKMATIFQQHQLIGRHSLLQNVLTGRIGYHGFWASLFMPANDRQLALAALDRVGLLDRALDRVDQLSGGQQQRVGIARALVQQPRLILADEPVASLDPISAQHILQLIERVCRQDGLSAIISLHQPALARQFADRILGIAGGDIVFDGPPEKLQDYDLSLIYPATPAPLHCQLPDTVQFSTELV